MLSIVRPWLGEIAAMMGSIASLATIVILLAVYDDSRVSLIYGVTLNAIIATLSTATKTTLLYVLAATIGQWKWILFSRDARPLMDAYIIDEASRGPLGSLRMLWRMKGSLLVSFGALCTIFALAADPFTQQLIQYQHIPVPSDSTIASIPRAQRFSKGQGSPMLKFAVSVGTSNATALHEGGDPNNSEFLLRSLHLIATGSYAMQVCCDGWDNDTGREITLSHITANHRFIVLVNNVRLFADASVQSAVLYGLTHNATSIKQQLPVACPNGNCTFAPFQSLAVCSRCTDLKDAVVSSIDTVSLASLIGDGGRPMSHGNATQFTLPNNLYISNFDFVSYGAVDAVSMVTFGTANASETVTLQDVDTLIWSMTIMRWLKASDPRKNRWPDVALDAIECGLFYCVNEYTSRMKDGLLYEEVAINGSARRSPDSWQYLNQTSNRFTWTGPLPSTLQYNMALALIPHTDLSLGADYNVSQSAVYSNSEHFRKLMVALTGGDHGNSMNGYYIGNRTDFDYAPGSMQALLFSEDLNVTFENIATSFSNAIRSEADNKTVQTGMTYTTQVRYAIVWPWISLHFFLVLLGLLDLLLIIVQTARGQVYPWKSHLLAVMAWGGQLNDPMTGAVNLDTMERLGQNKSVSLYQAVPPEIPAREKHFLVHATPSSWADKLPHGA